MRTMLLFPLIAISAFGAEAQVPPLQDAGPDSIARLPVPIVLARAPSFLPDTPSPGIGEEAFGPVVQDADSEPGSFWLGAFVGGAIAHLYASSDPVKRGVVGVFVPVAALMGGILFWTIGIG